MERPAPPSARRASRMIREVRGAAEVEIFCDEEFLLTALTAGRGDREASLRAA